MKQSIPSHLFRAALAGAALLGLSSCITTDGYYPGSGYGQSGYNSGYSQPYNSYSSGSSYRQPYYASRCSRCGYNPCRCSSGHDDHDNHEHENHGSSSSDKIRLIGGSQAGKPNRPEGAHTKEWYQKRGYDLDEFKHQHEDGEVHKGDDYQEKKKKKH